MTERTDQAGAARTILGNVHPAEMENPDMPNWLAVAQVHATLALVEQQRIANLIALGAQWEDTGHPALDAMAPVLRPEIAAALGIEEVQS